MSSQLYGSVSVYTGTWVNWSDGRVKGATITIPSRNSAYLIAFLALFVRVAGGHFWDILCYIVFQTRSTGKAQDGLFRQQQAILRNTSTDTSAVWQFLALGWYWRKRAKRVWGRTLPFALVAFLNVIAIGAAGIFVSRVTEVRSDVLIRGSSCGSWPNPYSHTTSSNLQETMMEQARFDTLLQTWFTTASQYAADCYGYDNSTSSNLIFSDCKAYGRNLIDWSVETTKCPFAEEMCIEDFAVRFDTGYIDSSNHLGINAPEAHRVQLRQVLECAPITTNGFQSGLLLQNETSTPSQDFDPLAAADHVGYIEYRYGPNVAVGSNASFTYSNDSFGSGYVYLTRPSYLIDNEFAFLANEDLSSIVPISQLNRTDADVYLYFLINWLPAFVEPVQDPWFQSLEPSQYQVFESNGSWANVTYYSASEPVTVVGCSFQQQWCNPAIRGRDRCTALTGERIGSPSEEIQLNTPQAAILKRISQAVYDTGLHNSATYLGGNILLAQKSVNNGDGAGLPDDQWILELNHFLGTSLTSMQLELMSYVAGLVDSANDKYLVQPEADNQWMCTNQIMQRDDFASFSILGLVLIFILGGSLIVVNMFLDRIIRRIRTLRSTHSGEFKNIDWGANHTLQLQSMAYEAAGIGTWKHDQYVPVTQRGETFGLPPNAMGRYRSRSLENGSRKQWPEDAILPIDSASNMKFESNIESKSIAEQGSHEDVDATAVAVTTNNISSGDFMMQDFSESLPDASNDKPHKYHRLPKWKSSSAPTQDQSLLSPSSPEFTLR